MKYNTWNVDLRNKGINSVNFTGDIHGNFESLIYDLLYGYKIENALVIICGDIGMGFYKTSYYISLFKHINNKLKEKNIYLGLFRGNHDNPMYFNQTKECAISLSDECEHLIFLDDYDVITTEEYNILVIGGARSIDKYLRQKEGYGWWEDENIKPLTTEVKERISHIDINIICSHSSPNFCEPFTKNGLEGWAEYDTTLIDDCNKERELLANVFETLISANNIKYWFYGHFHSHYENITNNGDKTTKFIGLDMLREKGQMNSTVNRKRLCDLYDIKNPLF